jgi:hypothetical protein
MVDKAHRLGLLPGWYLNNCGCAENHISDPKLVETIMAGSVKALAAFGFDGVKFDSCSQFHNLTHWAELLNATGRKVLIENCARDPLRACVATALLARHCSHRGARIALMLVAGSHHTQATRAAMPRGCSSGKLTHVRPTGRTRTLSATLLSVTTTNPSCPT